MIALRLVRLIESHADDLSDSLIEKLFNSPRAADMRKVPTAELRARIHEVLHHLSEWLLTKTDDEIERRYIEVGRQRAQTRGLAHGLLLDHGHHQRASVGFFAGSGFLA